MAENAEEQYGTPVSVGEDDWFDQWLETGTVAQRSVPIYGRPDLFARYEDLQRQLDVALQVEKAGERSLSEDGSSSIIERMEALYEQWQASKSVWFIRALRSDEIDAIRDECGFPDEPEEPGKDASEEAKAEHAAAQKAYETQARAADSKANTLMVSRALVKIENSAGETVREHITPEQVERMREKLGETQILRLVGAAMVAATQETSIPVPFSLRSSKSDRDS